MRAPNLLALFFSFSLVFVTAHAGTITYTVNSEADEIDDDVTDGICHTASGVCTLRAAVMQAVGKGSDDNLHKPARGSLHAAAPCSE